MAHKSVIFWTTHMVLVLAQLQSLLVPVVQAVLQNDCCEGLHPSTNRAYGDIPEEWYNDEANEIKQDDHRGLEDRSGTCGDIIYLKSGDFYNFKIELVTKLCSVIIKAGPGYTLKIPRTELTVQPCTEEHFYYIADNFQRKLVVCGDPLSVEIDHAKRLLLQYERRAATDTTFSLTVTAEAEEERKGRSFEDTDMETRFKSNQICPQKCGSGTPRLPSILPRPHSVLVRTEAVPGQFPFLTAIFIARRGAAQPERCGGSILDRRHVLTSAHCFRDEDDIEEIYVAPGGRHTVPARGEFTPRYSVKCVELLGYRVTEQGWRINDLAIVELGRDLSFDSNFSPVCLAGTDKFDAFALSVPGYSYPAVDPVTQTLNNTLPVDPKKLEVANVFVWPNNECERLYHHKLTDKQTCVYDHLNGTCNGQSGNPAMVKIDEKYYQVAVSSHGFPCMDGPLNRYGVFTSVAPFLRQIQQKIGSVRNC